MSNYVKYGDHVYFRNNIRSGRLDNGMLCLINTSEANINSNEIDKNSLCFVINKL